ncbi:MAG: fluoride efflux transporter CrcB [Gemmatimonadota bacterium]|nr:fluoride efflux transporter CrcB [Gemmatimonadota bacterium]
MSAQQMSFWVSSLLVGTGGFLGSVLRYSVSGAVYRLFPETTFPWGTLAVNVIGCGLIGALAGLTETRQLMGPEVRLLVIVGVLGGFTTFSTFGYETINLLKAGGGVAALGNVALHITTCLTAVWIGMAATTTGS